MDDPLHLGISHRESPEERRLRKRVFLRDDIHWCALQNTLYKYVFNCILVHAAVLYWLGGLLRCCSHRHFLQSPWPLA